MPVRDGHVVLAQQEGDFWPELGLERHCHGRRVGTLCRALGLERGSGTRTTGPDHYRDPAFSPARRYPDGFGPGHVLNRFGAALDLLVGLFGALARMERSRWRRAMDPRGIGRLPPRPPLPHPVDNSAHP